MKKREGTPEAIAEVRARLRHAGAATPGGLKAVAARIGVSREYLSYIVHGHSTPNGKVAAAMGVVFDAVALTTDDEAVLGENLRILFEQYFEPLCRYAYRFTGSVDEAKDIVQEVFLQVWRDRARVPPTVGQDFDNYLYALTRHRAIDGIRHERSVGRVLHKLTAYFNPVVDPWEEVDPWALTADTLAAIDTAIASLAPQQRRVLQLRWQAHASYAAIAARLGISEKTVAHHLERGVKVLRRTLGKVLR